MSSVTTPGREGSTFPLDVVVTDENGVVTPTTCKYTLKNRANEVINSVLNVPVTPSTSMRITLAGDDLLIEDETNDREYRRLLIETDQGDVAKPELLEVEFYVYNLKSKV